MSAEAPLRIFLIAGEHSGDALGAKLMMALSSSHNIEFAGVGGREMESQGLSSLFPIEDVAVMGPLNILAALPRIVNRVYKTVDAALAFRPDCVVIIDSPEFTHPIAKRIRKSAPQVPIVDYVSPSVWAWRPGRAKKMKAYVDEILALLPFEPEAHRRLGGPHCTYVGHPLIERLDEIRNASATVLAARLGLAAGRDVLLVLPGSRHSEVDRLLGDFGETVSQLRKLGLAFDVVIPAVPHVRPKIEAASKVWPVKVHVVGAEEKYAAMRLAKAALAASGTVTLELALAGVPMAVAYKLDKVSAPVMRRLVKADTVVLPNLVLGEKAFPEFIQDVCTAENLANALLRLLTESSARDKQLDALARLPAKLEISGGSPSQLAAQAVLNICADRHSS